MAPGKRKGGASAEAAQRAKRRKLHPSKWGIADVSDYFGNAMAATASQPFSAESIRALTRHEQADGAAPWRWR